MRGEAALEEEEKVSVLIGQIYDASLDPALWPVVLQRTCDYVQGVAAALVAHDSRDKTAQFYFSYGDDPYYSKLYNEIYVRLNPAIPTAIIEAKVGEVSAYLDFIPREEYVNSRFYKEWAGPQGYIDSVQVTLEKTATSYAAATVMRHKRNGTVDEATRRRMQLLAPHFLRAVSIGRVIALHTAQTSTLKETFDALSSGLFFVDGSARIMHTNAAGKRLLETGTILRGVHGKLSAVFSEAEQSLRDVFSACANGDIFVGTKGISVPLGSSEGVQWLAHVLPLTSGARRQVQMDYSAAAAVFVRKATLDLVSPTETMAKIFHLTPAELRVLLALINSGGIPEVAGVLGLTEPTVKTHLQHIFQKTNTTRQAELVKLTASFVSPLQA